MTVLSTTETWSVDGVPLNTYAYNIATIGGARFDFPGLRGSNIQSAYRPGTIWRPKTPDQRVITLLMWVAGIDPNTYGAPGPFGPEQTWNDNWNMLRRLFWNPRRQMQLTRLWSLTDPNTGLPALVSGTALVQLSPSPLSVPLTMNGPARANFAVDLVLSDPFFYGVPVSTTVNLGGGLTTVHNPGDDSAYYSGLSIAFDGTLSSPVLTNSTPTPSVSCSLSSALIGTTTLDVGAFTVSPSSYPLGSVNHSGARSWFGLEAGDNNVSLTGSGSGSAVITFSPPYL